MTIKNVISDCLREIAPKSLLILGAQSEQLGAFCQQVAPQTNLSAYDDPTLRPSGGRYDIAIISQLLEAWPKSEGMALIARLRDIECRYLLVAVSLGRVADQQWCENDLLSMGLKRLAIEQRDDEVLAAYDFNLRDYKLTPDWLNNRHWANPDLWDQHRW